MSEHLIGFYEIVDKTKRNFKKVFNFLAPINMDEDGYFVAITSDGKLFFNERACNFRKAMANKYGRWASYEKVKVSCSTDSGFDAEFFFNYSGNYPILSASAKADYMDMQENFPESWNILKPTFRIPEGFVGIYNFSIANPDVGNYKWFIFEISPKNGILVPTVRI